MKKRVLVLEDEPMIREFVEINLIRAGYDVLSAASGEEALALAEQNPDIVIALLDVMLPGIDGFTVCRRLREMGRTMGIIMLSAKTQEMDKVTGLMCGADDYVPKPFSPTELMLRVNALARRVPMQNANPAAEERLTSGRFVLDLRSRVLEKDGTPVELTQIEFALVRCFLKNPGKAISRTEILHEVWGEDFIGDDKIVDVNIRRLRLKIEDVPHEPQQLRSVRGYGYKWVK